MLGGGGGGASRTARAADAEPPLSLAQDQLIHPEYTEMDKILYLTRHAQAYHNVADDYTSPSISFLNSLPKSRAIY